MGSALSRSIRIAVAAALMLAGTARPAGIAAGAAAVALMATAKPAYALTVTAPATDAILNQILAEMKLQTAALNEIKATQAELVELNTEILAAIGPATTIASAAPGGLLDVDATQFGTIAPDLSTLELPDELPIPNLGDLARTKRDMTAIFGIFNRAEAALKSRDPEAAYRVLRDLGVIRRVRKEVFADRVTDTLSSGLYSLSQLPAAKAHEISLSSGKAGAGSLREDTGALHETMLTLLSRLNHMILLQGQQTAMFGAERVVNLPTGDTAVDVRPIGQGINPGGGDLELTPIDE